VFLHGAKVNLSAATATATSDPLNSKEFESLCNQIPPEYHNFLDVFSKSKADKLPDHNPAYDHHINLEEGKQSPFGPIYSLSEVRSTALHDFLQENLTCNFICPSQSACGAPVLFVKKKDSSLQLCVNWCRLNTITKKDQYPLPLIPNLLDRLHGSCIYTKIDLWGTYNLVQIAPSNKWKTAFWTHYGSFDFLVMHFSLTNALATFQQLMNTIFADCLDYFVVVYLDDILIFSKNPEEHTNHVCKVLMHLQKNSLFAKPEKCKFSVNTTEFLGFVISPNSISMSKSKVDAILQWPTPKNLKQVQSFLGFANFY